MKLTKSDRDAFVRAVMDDVPQVDYDEEAKKLAQAALLDAMPKKVRAAYDAHPEYFKSKSVETPYHLRDLHVFGVPDSGGYGCLRTDSFIEVWAELQHLAERKDAQKEKLSRLREKLAAVIGGCSTLKQAQERLPEFIKYLPADRTGTGVSGLPVVANVVADLTAAGWPK